MLVVTEKPSVARDIGATLGCTTRRDGWIEGNNTRITWCLGHLCELDEPKAYDPDWERWSLDALPMLPRRFKLRVRAENKQQWAVLEKLLRASDVGEVVNACDAGREGELIFRYVYELAGCTRPVSRLWVASMTDHAIRLAWASRRPASAYDALADAARCRSEADWVVGLNATRGLTCLSRAAGGDQLLSVGRVQTPTLAMIVARDAEIAAFVPVTYWRVDGQLVGPDGLDGGALRARWFRHDLVEEAPPRPAEGQDGEGKRGDAEEEAPAVERLDAAELAEGLCAALRGGKANVIKADRRERREAPPLLYDLTALQRRANQRFGFTADQTLAIAQELYEKKLITYPRTDARFLTDDQVPELPGILRKLALLRPYQPFCDALLGAPIRPGKRVVNAEEVGDHHAILPTGVMPDVERLPADHKRIYDLIARRLLAALSGDAVFDVTALVFEVVTVAPIPESLPAPPQLRARGRVCREEGWQAVDPPGRRGDRSLPLLTVGDALLVRDAEATEAQTRPPKPHNDATLLARMEGAGRELSDAELKRALRGAGLGTPATRAEVLKTLLKRQFIVRAGKDLRATPLGVALIAAVPVPALKSPELTGRWEARLSAVAEGKEARARFMADVATWTSELVDAIRGATPPPVAARALDGPVVGPCPRCGAAVHAEGGRFCCGAAGCGFQIWGTVAGRKLSPRMVKQLLVDKKTPSVKGFKSKAGKAFEAGLRLNDELKVVFDFGDPEGPIGAPPVGLCPRCGGPVREGRGRFACGGEGCSFVVWGSVAERALSGAEVGQLLTTRRTAVLTGFRSKAGKEFEAALRLNDDLKVVFDFPGRQEGAPMRPEGLSCPSCGVGEVVAGRAAWGCSRWREGCGWRRPFVVEGAPIDPAAVAAELVAAARVGQGQAPAV
ncbi:MAG: DNA topoisomerase 3 [Deltaproteobacteria bacterium]|nr:DNA topoisomerase 3 [Deltaproteobacteria bacterium]